MNETYTFSRALYLMRYGGKTMFCNGEEYIVKNNTLYRKIPKSGVFFPTDYIDAVDIMDEWEEVK